MAKAKEDLLVPRNEYLSAGVHIGMPQHTASMGEFIFKVRTTGLTVLDVQKLDQRIRVAGKFISRAKKPLVAARKPIAKEAAEKFAETIGCKAVSGRFYPGTLTNSSYKKFYEPDLVIVADSMVDSQVINEALQQRIPIIALCDTYDESFGVDIIIPTNNKGKKSIALVFWLLAREVLKNRKEIKNYKDFKVRLEDFESKQVIKPKEEEEDTGRMGRRLRGGRARKKKKRK